MVVALDCGTRGREIEYSRPLFILLMTNHIFIWGVNNAFSRKWLEEDRRGRKDVWKRARKAHEECGSGDTKRSQLPRWKKRIRDRNLEGKRTCSKMNSFEFVRRDGENIAQTAKKVEYHHQIQNTKKYRLTEYTEYKP